MEVIVSKKTRYQVYHRPECVCLSRMDKENRQVMSRQEAEATGYHTCRCCGSGKYDGTWFTPESARFTEWEEKYHISIDFMTRNQVIYVRTNIGCWRISRSSSTGYYILFHMNNCKNNYDRQMPLSQVKGRPYHRQGDVKPSETIHKLLVYIYNHDKAKVTIMDDYRKLPRNTTKQRKYYRQAKNAERRKSIKKVYAIFEELEQQGV